MKKKLLIFASVIILIFLGSRVCTSLKEKIKVEGERAKKHQRSLAN